MVQRKKTYHNVCCHQVHRSVGQAKSSMHKQYTCARKNELVHPISPFDEIPAIRDLVKQLSPEPRSNPKPQRPRTEMRQIQQDNNRRKHHQQRDARAPSPKTPVTFPSFINHAHEVPSMIHVPMPPSFSEDSELSLEDCFGKNAEDDLNWPSDEEKTTAETTEHKKNTKKCNFSHRVRLI